jgi:3-deoxy-D-manno-octulosonic-acid transferase
VRLSQRSLEGYQRWAGRLTAEALQHVQWAGVQSGSDRKRLVALGADHERVTVTGSIKFDLALPNNIEQQGEELRKMVAGERPVWIAASTREGEERYILDAHQQLLKRFADLLLILVPRHPERFNGVAREVLSAGVEIVRRSSGERCQERTQVYLGDTMGEMLRLYAVADVAYVGGSLVPTGSHNMLEPAALGKPVLFGPHRFNFAEISQLLIDQGAAQEVTSAGELADAVAALLQQPEKRRRQGQQGRRVVEQNRGALQRLLKGVRAHLPEWQSPAH